MHEEEKAAVNKNERFRKAKAEHYLDRAMESVNASRYLAAKKLLKIVREVDPTNALPKILDRTVDEHLQALAYPKHNGNDNGKKRSGIVVIIDQDHRILESLSTQLQREGYRVAGAESYEEAMETFSMIHPDIVISEINFETGPRGYDIFSWMKWNKEFTSIPFIFLAEKLDRDVLVAGKRFGVDDFIAKPADPAVISASIASCLLRKRSMS